MFQTLEMILSGYNIIKIFLTCLDDCINNVVENQYLFIFVMSVYLASIL